MQKKWNDLPPFSYLNGMILTGVFPTIAPSIVYLNTFGTEFKWNRKLFSRETYADKLLCIKLRRIVYLCFLSPNTIFISFKYSNGNDSKLLFEKQSEKHIDSNYIVVVPRDRLKWWCDDYQQDLISTNPLIRNNVMTQLSSLLTVSIEIVVAGEKQALANYIRDSTVNRANMGPIWVLSYPDGPLLTHEACYLGCLAYTTCMHHIRV